MPTIAQFYGIVIRMYFNDHDPPHFHALYDNHEAVVDIATLRISRGYLPGRALALVEEWASEHRAELIEDWELCRLHRTPRKIAPLA